MAGLVELLAGPGSDGQVEGRLALEPDPAPAAVVHGGPAHVAAVAVLLRVQVRGLELRHRGREAADPGRSAGVGVGLAGPAPGPLDVPEPGRHRHPQPQPRPRAGPIPLGHDLDLQPQAALDHRPPVGDRHPQVGRGGRHPGPRHQAVALQRDPVHPVPQPVQPDPPPHRRQRLPVVPLVVVGRPPPQVQHRPVHVDLPDPHQPSGGRVKGPGSHHQGAVDNRPLDLARVGYPPEWGPRRRGVG